jgi:hypothetical protein
MGVAALRSKPDSLFSSSKSHYFFLVPLYLELSLFSAVK